MCVCEEPEARVSKWGNIHTPSSHGQVLQAELAGRFAVLAAAAESVTPEGERGKSKSRPALC